MGQTRGAANERSSALIFTPAVDRLTDADWEQVRCICLSRCARLEMSLPLFDRVRPRWQTSLQFSSICMLGTGITAGPMRISEMLSLASKIHFKGVLQQCTRQKEKPSGLSVFPCEPYHHTDESWTTCARQFHYSFTFIRVLLLFTVVICWTKDLSLCCELTVS